MKALEVIMSCYQIGNRERPFYYTAFPYNIPNKSQGCYLTSEVCKTYQNTPLESIFSLQSFLNDTSEISYTSVL